MPTAFQVKAEFLKVWPKGAECEHTHAREGFRLLDEMIAQEDDRARRHNEARQRIPEEKP